MYKRQEWDNNETEGISIPSSGVYKFTIRRREDDLRIDRLVLTTDAAAALSGDGPAESPRELASVTIPTPTLTAELAAPGDTSTIDLSFPATVGYIYTIQIADNLCQWLDASAPISVATAATVEETIDLVALETLGVIPPSDRCFFRLHVEVPSSQ